ncbi:MAG: M20/M25/M40 family metallo-hydrolase [Desulfobacterales bacterium]|jgi:arginine utilization protein RocB
MKQSRSVAIEALMLNLVAIQSDTGTQQEKDVETYIHDWLGRHQYFKNHPDYFGMHRLENDPLGRSIVWGLVKGQGDQTVILMHHHDAVDAFDYGSLAKWAYDPPNLQTALTEMELTLEAHADLEGGQWIFGRGTADMKAGAAIQCVVLMEYAARANFRGNLLLLSVPDEENLSEGMRGSLSLLVDLKVAFNLNYKMLINSEPHAKVQDHEGTFHVGSAGKLLPTIYVRGKKSHIGHIYQGFNPVLLLSEIVLQTELNTDYCDVVRGEVSPPPSWSFMRDNKEVYDASIPASAGGYLSLISLKKSPRNLMRQLKATCEESVDLTLDKIRRSHSAYCRKSGRQESDPTWRVAVRTFSEIYKQALKDSGQAFTEAYTAGLESVVADVRRQRLNSPEATLKIIEMTLEHLSDLSPMVVIALSPPYYPAIHNDEFSSLPRDVADLPDYLIDIAQNRWQEVYQKKNYLMGLTDLSYAALQAGQDIVPVIGPNMPLWQKTYDIPFDEMAALSVPVINIGPWGKDLHKFTERVYKTDLCERTPQLLESAIDFLIGESQDQRHRA